MFAMTCEKAATNWLQVRVLPGPSGAAMPGIEKVRAPRSGGMRGIGRRGAQASSGKGGSANRGLARIVSHDEHRLYRQVT